jgi:Zn-dependent peptidase ImmA (M78 family)
LHSEEVVQDVEERANAFAAEFLMPIEVIRPQLRNLRAPQLFNLKREWGVPMAALVERAFHEGLMRKEQRTSMYKMFAARGWRIREPLSDELAAERPTLTRTIPHALMAEDSRRPRSPRSPDSPPIKRG